MGAMMRVTLYTREDCSLCDEVKADLAELQSVVPHRLVEVDVDSDPVLTARHGESVPVVEAGPYTLRAPFNATDLKVVLLSAQRSQMDRPQVTGEARERAVGMHRAVRAFSRHWLAVLNTIVFLYVALPFAAPALMNAGLRTPARWIYTIYSPVCHQLAFRSWFLFGEQAAYPRALAGTSLTSFGQATGLPEDDLLAARSYIGEEGIGYKVALCERDVAIYGGIFLAGIVFSFVRHRLRPLPIMIWFILGVVPMALDGVTQLFSGFPILPQGIMARESTPFLRTATGLLFGVLNVWLAYPHLEQSMAETRAATTVKLAAVEADKK
jgi:uncharacterized membrane protein